MATGLGLTTTRVVVAGTGDDQSVLLVDGVKRTTQTAWPDALVVADLLAEAPMALNLAGIGDLAAMFTAAADWRLASMLGMGGVYSEPVAAMVRA